mmetsp:Transcript_8206/g.24575  ORF Transcript_8206/g.24575 Transcript_8206/m.24575 type:complete len:472 (-) Transcript_8206:150-1565(-)
MDSGHETLLESEFVIDDLGNGSKAVGRARGVGDDIHGGVVALLVNAHDKHGRVRGGSGDDNLLGTSSHVKGGLLSGGEDSGRFDDVVSTGGSPLDLGGVHLAEDRNGLAIDGEGAVSGLLDSARVGAVDCVVLEHVLHVVDRDEGVVDCDDVHHRVILGCAHHEATNAAKAVDSNVDGLEGFLRALAVHDIGKLGLEGGTSNKESINVFLGRKARGGGPASGPAVKDAGVGSDVGASNLAEVLTDVSVCVLGLLRGGSEAGANGPDGLVGDDNIGPVLLGEDVGVRLDLGEDEFVRGASLAGLKGLAAAGDHLEALVECVFGLLGHLLVRLALSAALGMSDDGPAHAHILEHVSGGFAGEGSISLDPAVLRSDSDVGSELLLHALNVNLRRAHDNLRVRAESRLVEHRDEVVHLRDGAVALPVASDEEFAGLRARRRMVGASGGLGGGIGDGASGSGDHGVAGEEMGFKDG